MLLYLWHPGTHCESLAVNAVLDGSEAKDQGTKPQPTHHVESLVTIFEVVPSCLPSY